MKILVWKEARKRDTILNVFTHETSVQFRGCNSNHRVGRGGGRVDRGLFGHRASSRGDIEMEHRSRRKREVDGLETLRPESVRTQCRTARRITLEMQQRRKEDEGRADEAKGTETHSLASPPR